MRMLMLTVALSVVVSLPVQAQSALPPARPQPMKDVRAELMYRVALAERCEGVVTRLWGRLAEPELTRAQREEALAGMVDMFGYMLTMVATMSMPQATVADREYAKVFLVRCASKFLEE